MELLKSCFFIIKILAQTNIFIEKASMKFDVLIKITRAQSNMVPLIVTANDAVYGFGILLRPTTNTLSLKEKQFLCIVLRLTEL